MFMPEMNRERRLAELLARLANYRPAVPIPGLLSEETWRLPVRAADRDMGNPPPVVLAQAEQDSDDDNILHDGVVNQFRDRLDPEGLRFLKSGPVTPDEKRADGQRVHPDAHLSAAMAPADLRRRYQDAGHFDRVRYFAGPDNTLYARDASSREMLAQRLRRGMQRAVAGETPPAPPPIPRYIKFQRRKSELERAVAAEPPSLQARQRKTMQRQALEGLRVAEGIIADARQYKLDHAANALEHFLQVDGAPVIYDHQEFLESPTARAAEAMDNQHNINWMLGTHPKSWWPFAHRPNEIKENLLAMKDGETIHSGDHWDAVLPYPNPRLALEALVPDWKPPSTDADWYGTIGEAQLESDSGFEFTRTGDAIDFRGIVEYDFGEDFDFELDRRDFPAPAAQGFLPWVLSQEQGVAMQKLGIGKPYYTTSQWNRPVTGTLRLNPDGTLELERIDWGDPYRRPGPRSM